MIGLTAEEDAVTSMTAEEAFLAFLKVAGLEGVPDVRKDNYGGQATVYDFEVDHPKVCTYVDYHCYYTEVSFDADGNLIEFGTQ